MRKPQRGVSTALIAVIVIVIIAAAAGVYALVITPAGSSTSSSLLSTTSSSLPPTTSSIQSSSEISSSASTTSTTPTTTPSSTTESSTTTTSSSSTLATSTTSSSLSTTTYTTIYSTTYTFTYSTNSSTTCTSTSSTNSTSEAQVDNFSQTFSEYSEMAVRYNGTENGNTFDMLYDYQVVSTTPKAFEVNVTSTEGPLMVHFTDFVLKNGTAVWVYYNGQNYTGVEAFAFYFLSLAPYILGNAFGEAGLLGQLSNSTMIHVSGTGTLMLGPTEVNVTDYAPNSLPLSEVTCGESVYFTRFSLQEGSVPGDSVQLLTAMDIAGTIISGGVADSVSLSLHITSVTKAT